MTQNTTHNLESNRRDGTSAVRASLDAAALPTTHVLANGVDGERVGRVLVGDVPHPAGHGGAEQQHLALFHLPTGANTGVTNNNNTRFALGRECAPERAVSFHKSSNVNRSTSERRILDLGRSSLDFGRQDSLVSLLRSAGRPTETPIACKHEKPILLEIKDHDPPPNTKAWYGSCVVNGQGRLTISG